jgi:hypothetical protein
MLTHTFDLLEHLVVLSTFEKAFKNEVLLKWIARRISFMKCPRSSKSEFGAISYECFSLYAEI